jgi:AcrR family transcriptional regulator
MTGVVERWTRERRAERTRSLLIDAAEEVFARKGFDAASLEDIADGAGYTRGAIYAHFGAKAKEDLLLAVSDRFWQRYFDNFSELRSLALPIEARELDRIAERWRDLSRTGGVNHAALGHEFILYLLRNPAARERVAAKRLEVVETLARFIVEGVDRLGATLTIPAETLAQVLISTSDGVILASELDGVDLYRPMLEIYVSAIKLPD